MGALPAFLIRRTGNFRGRSSNVRQIMYDEPFEFAAWTARYVPFTACTVLG